MGQGPGRHGAIGPIALWMTGALFAFIVVSVTVRDLTAHLNALEIGVVRTALGLMLLATAGAVSPALRTALWPVKPLAHLPRNLVHATGGIAWTLAIAGLPFATVFSLEFTAPAWVAVLAYPVLRERITRRTVAGIAACILGVLVIMRPGLEPISAPMVAALAAAFCFGLSIILTRQLARTQSVYAILLWMMVWQLAFYVLAVLLSGSGAGFRTLATPRIALVAVLLGCAGLIAQLCLAGALRIGDAATVVPLDFLRVPMIALIGWFFYGEPLSAWVFVGAALILLGITHGILGHATRDGPTLPPDPDTRSAGLRRSLTLRR